MPNSFMQNLFQEVSAGKSVDSFSPQEKQAVFEVIEKLDQGQIRVAEKNSQGIWQVNEWIKQAILLYFRLMKMQLIRAGDLEFFDKIPLKKWTPEMAIRTVPPALARYGAFLQPGVILMPSFLNLGAYVGTGTMVDTWATVGSCAQIGQHVHLSGGVGIGGVLEPVQAAPVIIEDHVFVGSRCILVEGVHIEEGAVIGAGVTITSSTKILDVSQAKEIVYQGRVPANSVVIPGTTQKTFPAGTFGVPCALIIGKRKASTDLKTSLTQALRDFQIQV